MKNKIKKIGLISLVVIGLSGCTFATDPATSSEIPGFFMGIWHGILAPYTLIVRFFLSIQMYAMPNSGLGYDAGFLLGVIGAIPLGWLATIISVVFFLLTG